MSTVTAYSNRKLSEIKTALVVGCLYGTWHLLWSLLVAAGVAQTLLDWICRLHFLNNPFRVAEFNLMNAALLVAITFLVGFVIGWFFALLWNLLHKPEKLRGLA